MSDDIEGLGTIDLLALRARENVDPDVWDFLEGAAGDELTAAANRGAFGKWRFRPRALTGMSAPATATRVLGLDLATPLMVAPFAGDQRIHRDGFEGVLHACADLGTLAVVPELTAAPLEALAKAAPEAARIFQLSLLGTEQDFARLAGRAKDAGYRVLCVTVDAPVVGIRRRNATSPGAVVHLALGNFGPDSGIDSSEYFGHVHRLDRPDWTWDQLAHAASDVGMPFIVKGVLTAEDARAAVGAGAVGVYVSNHGGRQLDRAPATIDALVEIVDEVGNEVDVLFDGGVRGGAEAMIALALGADAVLVGRAAAFGLAAAGRAGVARALGIIQHELETTMTLLGRSAIADLDRSVVTRV